ncbi:MAG: hypothetical protein KatS3mg081_0132 [Gemmatimonadales bacterium]|nr:MAG: hypothetical protein KatS3mg081_0132 [Gemmatimonadales bacterium]
MRSYVPAQYIHYDPTRVDYSRTESELNQLKTSAHNHWKDLTIASIALAVPCLVNAATITTGQEAFVPTLPFVLNLLVGLVGIGLGVGFGIAWRRTSVDLERLIGQIKAKPKMVVVPKVTNITLPHPKGGNS